MSSIKWKVLWNTSAQVIGRLVGAGTTFILAVIIARTFGVQGFGDFTKITTYVAIFYLLADFGMNAVFLQKTHPSASFPREGSGQAGQADSSWGELLGVRVIGSVALMIGALVILVFLPQGVGQGYTAAVRLGIILFLPSILFQAVITTANAQFQRTLRYDVATAAIIVGSLVAIMAMWIVVVSPLVNVGVIGVIGVIGAGSLVTAAAALLFVKKLGSSLRLSITRTSLVFYFTRSLPLGMMLIFNLIYFRADHLILTLSRSTAEVGIYGLAYKVFEFPLAIPTFIMNSVYPLFLATQNHELKKKFRTMFLFMIPASCFMILILWMAAPLLSLVRPEFGSSVGAVRVLSLGLPFFFLTNLTMWTLIALKRQKILAIIYGASMVVNVLLNGWLVPTYGYMAAAWITVFSEGLVMVMSGTFVLRVLRRL